MLNGTCLANVDLDSPVQQECNEEDVRAIPDKITGETSCQQWTGKCFLLNKPKGAGDKICVFDACCVCGGGGNDLTTLVTPLLTSPSLPPDRSQAMPANDSSITAPSPRLAPISDDAVVVGVVFGVAGVLALAQGAYVRFGLP